MNTRLAFIALITPAFLFLGCDRNAPETINTSETSPQQPAPGGAPTAPPAGAPADMTPPAMPNAGAAPRAMATAAPDAGAQQAGRVLTYKLPAGWTEEPGGNAMRFATLKGPDNAQVTVSVFGGNVGGDLANVNRWRGQLELPPITQEQLDQNLTKVQTAGPVAQMTDLKKADGSQRLLAAIIPDEGKTWFLKFQGPADVVTRHADEYTQILKSCAFAQPQP